MQVQSVWGRSAPPYEAGSEAAAVHAAVTSEPDAVRDTSYLAIWEAADTVEKRGPRSHRAAPASPSRGVPGEPLAVMPAAKQDQRNETAHRTGARRRPMRERQRPAQDDWPPPPPPAPSGFDLRDGIDDIFIYKLRQDHVYIGLRHDSTVNDQKDVDLIDDVADWACSLHQRRAAKYGYQGANRYCRDLAGVTRSFSDKCLRIVRYACAGRPPHGTSRTSYTARCGAFLLCVHGRTGNKAGREAVGRDSLDFGHRGTEKIASTRPLARPIVDHPQRPYNNAATPRARKGLSAPGTPVLSIA